jgi:hypothetical protein
MGVRRSCFPHRLQVGAFSSASLKAVAELQAELATGADAATN